MYIAMYPYESVGVSHLCGKDWRLNMHIVDQLQSVPPFSTEQNFMNTKPSGIDPGIQLTGTA